MTRTVHVEHCMGTVFTLDVRDPGDWNHAIAEAVAWLYQVDAVFSTYRPDSDLNRLGRRELRLADAHPDLALVLDLCAQVQAETGGAFSALFEGRVDPTGLVKGWAIERASDLLRQHGSGNHAVNGGGDLQLAGESAPGQPWRVGIAASGCGGVGPVVAGQDFAVATSGTAERGQHILDPFTGRAAEGLFSASVTGPSLTRADAYATAAFVLGTDAMRWVKTVPGYELLLIWPDGRTEASPGWPAFRSTE